MMNFAFLPDLSALTILMVILLLVRRRHPGPRPNAWLLGLLFTLTEEVVHTFYPAAGMPASFLHVMVVDSYLLAGTAFIWGAGAGARSQHLSRNSRLLYLALNGLPLFALTTIYGLNLRMAQFYIPAIAAGIVLGVASSLWVRRNWLYASLYTLGWIAVGLLVHRGMFREAVYWTLACVYAIAAIKFERRLEGNTTGKLAIVPGFSLWAFCFLLHPWVVTHLAYADIASHVLNLQNSLVAIGMILVLLEEQVSTNQWLALHDELTGLPNRRMFASRLDVAIERADRDKTTLALVVLDLDGFKKINDSLGHFAGDHVLREVSTTLRKSLRASDTVARLGGDEFIIMATEMNSEKSVQRFVDSIASAIQRPILFNSQSILITASLGIAIYPDDADDAIKLLRLADQRMYFLKKRPVQPSQIEAAMAALSPPA
jgi:diguanylate cyclase (GGDEF)-like protein